VGSTHLIDLPGFRLKNVDGTSEYVNDADSAGYSLRELPEHGGEELDSGDLDLADGSVTGRYVGRLEADVTADLVVNRRYDLYTTLVKDTNILVRHLRLVGTA
jgi:hypothetical protein